MSHELAEIQRWEATFRTQRGNDDPQIPTKVSEGKCKFSQREEDYRTGNLLPCTHRLEMDYYYRVFPRYAFFSENTPYR